MVLSTPFWKRCGLPLLIVIAIFAVIYSLRQAGDAAWTSDSILPFASKAAPAKNVAVIIEDRPLSNLAPLLLHFSSVLGPDWPIVLYTSEGKQPGSLPFRRAVEEGRISVRNLPDGIAFTQHQAVSQFLTSPWLWDQLAPAGHVLLFQADSILCANSDLRVDDFLGYDFVGAPIYVPANPAAGHGEGLNGGLSLRNRSMILDIVKNHSWQTEMDDGTISQEGCVTTQPCLKFEDQWFYHKMKNIAKSSEGQSVARLPTVEVASTFAVETVWHDAPLGYHQVARWNTNKMDKVTKWCPEIAIATEDLLIQHK
ncbi:hypothetical protein PVAG01_10316 [Phlyctema vagabunda]|uniref:DUF5672 domain-containing protein n=1 Tax=Phlyctema vagabunda TaxID=108571 RepID=A0ABR4P5M5_9HELO